MASETRRTRLRARQRKRIRLRGQLALLFASVVQVAVEGEAHRTHQPLERAGEILASHRRHVEHQRRVMLLDPLAENLHALIEQLRDGEIQNRVGFDVCVFQQLCQRAVL